MKNKRLRNYPEQKSTQKNRPIRNKQDIQNNSDKHIDQDFAGYPHAPAKEELIKPQTSEQKKTAAVNTKDGEKMMGSASKKKASPAKSGDEADDGSANAFEQTEALSDDE